MLLRNLVKIANALINKYPPDSEVWLDDENIMVAVDGQRYNFNPDDILLNDDISHNIIWDGISAVRAWTKGGKQRVYFRAVGVPESAHRSGRVFLELVNGYWMPNMRYQLMVGLANQLNEAKLFDAEKVEEAYRDFVENN